MAAIDCSVSCCDILDMAYQMVNQRRYGVKCEDILYCNFAKYYLEECKNEAYNTLLAEREDNVTTILSIAFTGHICSQVELEAPVETYWLGTEPFCVQDGGENTGMQGYTTLVEYYTENNIPTGVTKPNTIGDPDYVAPVENLEDCYLTYHACTDTPLEFESADATQISLLSVGALVSTGNTIGNYLIEWRLGSVSGPLALISGIGSNPLIQATHPFVYEPVQGGDLYPVIREVEINGFLYTNVYNPIARYSPDLTDCIPHITVQALNCSNGGVIGDYTHQISYVNSIDAAKNAERTIKFDLSADGSTNYFAWQFQGYSVADRVAVSYVSVLDPENPVLLSDWIVGVNSNITSLTSNPKRWGNGNQTLRAVNNLTDIPYNVGDYLLIHITPRVYEPTNTNTNWTFTFRCLSTFTCAPVSGDVQNIDTATIAMTWDEANCRYVVAFDTLQSYLYGTSGSDSYKYVSFLTSATSGLTVGALHSTAVMNKNTTNTLYQYLINISCTAQSGSATMNKVGNVITMVFTQNSDYLRYKDAYNAILVHPNFTTYTADNTQLNHYKFFQIYLRSANSCGDTGVTMNFYIHMSSIFTFDDGTKTMTITINNTTNGLPVIACNNANTVVNTPISSCATAITYPNFSYNTNVAAITPIGGVAYTPIVNDETNKTFYYYWQVPPPALDDSCELATPWCLDASGYMRLYKVGIRIQITDNTDPINNWRLQQIFTPEGCAISNALLYITIYEIVDGVVIIPAP